MPITSITFTPPIDVRSLVSQMGPFPLWVSYAHEAGAIEAMDLSELIAGIKKLAGSDRPLEISFEELLTSTTTAKQVEEALKRYGFPITFAAAMASGTETRHRVVNLEEFNALRKANTILRFYRADATP